MIIRLKKEIRGQLAALGLVALTACLVAFRMAFIRGSEDALRPTFFLEVSPFLSIAAICMAASAFYTSEYHWRTFQLLLAQPISRARIWTEKLATIIVCVALFGIAFAMLNAFASALFSPEAEQVMWRYSLQHMRSGSLGPWWLAIMVTVFSAPFWSMIARTLIGAVALNLASQALALILLNAAFQHLQPGTRLFVPGEQPWGLMPVLWVLGIAYAGVFAWLGWRKFKRLELVDGAGDVVVGGQGLFGTPWKASLPRGAGELGTLWKGCLPRAWVPRTGPLLAKELRLQRPTLLLAGLLVAVWLAAVALRWVFPGTKEDVELFLALAAGFYVPLVVLLSASISISEESRIGIYEWHLSFPIPRWRLWALKLGVGLGSAIMRGVLIPIILGVVTFPEFRRVVFEMLTGNGEVKAAPFIIILGTLFVVGFWSAVYLRDTIRSILGAVLVIVVGGGLITFSGWTTEFSELQKGVVSWYIAWQQLNTYTAMNHIGRFAFVVACLGLPALLLWLSFRAIRRNTQGLRAFKLVAALVLAILLLLAFWIGDLVRSVPAAQRVFADDLRSAIQMLPANPHDKEGVRLVTLQELERTGLLLPVTRFWLRDCTIRLVPQGELRLANIFNLGITFPSGHGDMVTIPPPLYLWPTNKINTAPPPKGEQQFMRRYGVDATPR